MFDQFYHLAVLYVLNTSTNSEKTVLTARKESLLSSSTVVPVVHTVNSVERAQLDQMVQDYCHLSLLKTVNGEEGIITETGRYEIVQVHTLMRHGDRSSVATYLNYQPKVELECGMIDKDHIWEKLNDFKITKLESSSHFKSKNKHKLFRGYKSLPCKKGELTFQGFKQLYALGLFISDSYAKLFTTHPDEIYVQSTDHKRTIGSAAAFLLGFIPEDAAKLRSSVPIHVSPGTLLEVPPLKTLQAYPPCKKLPKTIHGEREISGYLKKLNKKRHICNEIVHIAGLPNSIKAGITQLYDPLWTRLCHKKPLPCGPKSCINDSLLLEGAKLAHWSSANKLGNISSILSMQPFLYHSVISQMDDAIQSVLESKPYHHFMLSFAHDSTLSPLLQSLGIPQLYCLPYASRLVIELWRDYSKKRPTVSSYYIRILFNGDNLTKHLPFHDRYFTSDHQLLKYTVWKNSLVTGQYRELTSYMKACRAIK